MSTVFDRNEKIYFAPQMPWRLECNSLYIACYHFTQDVASLFPEFYYLTSFGIVIDELTHKLKDVLDKEKTELIVRQFLSMGIVVTSPQQPNELFYTQGMLYQSHNKFNDSIKIKEDELNSFKKAQLARSIQSHCNAISLKNCDNEIPTYLLERRTQRSFSVEKIGIDKLSMLFSALKQRTIESEIKYMYSSAGGLYPIDFYLYVKENRVEGLAKGLYVYSPLKNTLTMIEENLNLNEEVHFFQNQEIFLNSACSLFLVYNANTNMPKYDGMGYYYAILDAGIAIHALTVTAQLCGIGLCSIGDMDFDSIRESFNLNNTDVYLHCIELGLSQEKKEGK